MKKIKRYLPEIILLIGSFTFIYNVFSFDYSRGCGLSFNSSLRDSCSNPVAYHYDDEVLFFLALGFTLIVLGILLIKDK